MRRLLIAITFVGITGTTLSAQLVIFDPAVTFRNALTAILSEYLFNTERDQQNQLRRMARRLSAFADLNRYYLTDIPYWRIHNFWDADISEAARNYHAALNYGDRSGAAFVGATLPLREAEAALARLDANGRRVLLAQLATVNVADAVAISGTDQAGLLRFNGRKEYDAIEALQSHVIDPSLEQSATAVLDKVSGAILIGARQRQARGQMLAGVLEQLLVDSKRDRDTAASAINRQLVTWRDSRAVNDAFVAGSGEALQSWRQR